MAVESPERDRALALHRDSIVVDGHIGTLYDVRTGMRDFLGESSAGHADLPRLTKGGATAVFMSAFPEERIYPIRGVRQGLEYVDAFTRLCGSQGMIQGTGVGSVRGAKIKGELALFLAFEGGEMLDGSIEALRMFYRLGLRMLALTWNDRNLLGDGAGWSFTRSGLTPFGLEVLREAGNLGIIVDVSHLSEAGFWDVAEHAEKPFVASHSNCHKLLAHPRNLTDDQLRAIADTGGLVGISFNPEYLTGTDETPEIEDVVEHLMHALEVVGPEHVGIGSDFDSFNELGPVGLEDASMLVNLTEKLLEKGVSEDTVKLVLGGNWLRVIEAVVG